MCFSCTRTQQYFRSTEFLRYSQRMIPEKKERTFQGDEAAWNKQSYATLHVVLWQYNLMVLESRFYSGSGKRRCSLLSRRKVVEDYWRTRHRACASSCMISKHWRDLVDEWDSITGQKKKFEKSNHCKKEAVGKGFNKPGGRWWRPDC